VSARYAKDLSGVTRLHREYVQAERPSLPEKANEMGQIMSRSEMNRVTPKTYS